MNDLKFIIWNSIVWILKFEVGFRFRFKMNKIYFLIIIFLNKIILKFWFLSLLFHLHFLSFCLSPANPHNTIHQNSATFFYHHQNYPKKKKKNPHSRATATQPCEKPEEHDAQEVQQEHASTQELQLQTMSSASTCSKTTVKGKTHRFI